MTIQLEVYTLLKEIALIVDDGDRQFLSRFNLTVPRFYALLHLECHPGISLRQLSECMLCDKSNVTRLIKGLETEGLVERRPHETDGRVVRLFLTRKGKAIQRQVVSAHKEYNHARFEQLRGRASIKPFLDVLRQLKVELQNNLTGA